jgi:hypothetical protein
LCQVSLVGPRDESVAESDSGSPPIWKNTPFNKTHPLTIRPDVEVFQGSEVFVDHGSGTKQAESLLAMLTAVELCTPDFNWNPSDIVSDRNSLRNLLRWVTWDSSARWRPRNFRIDMHLAGEKTLVLTRWKRDIVQRPAEHSYGFSYERSETVPVPGCALSRAAGHDRIMAYVSILTICLHRPSHSQISVGLWWSIHCRSIRGRCLSIWRHFHCGGRDDEGV